MANIISHSKDVITLVAHFQCIVLGTMIDRQSYGYHYQPYMDAMDRMCQIGDTPATTFMQEPYDMEHNIKHKHLAHNVGPTANNLMYARQQNNMIVHMRTNDK